jgi:hypothetical protein
VRCSDGHQTAAPSREKYIMATTTNARRFHRSIVLAAAMTLSACSAPPQSKTPSPSLTIPQHLTLSTSAPDRLGGRYTYRETTILFDFRQDAQKLEFVIRNRDGAELFREERAGDVMTMSAYGGRATIDVDLSIVRESARQATLPDDQRTPFDAGLAVIQTGDQKLFEQFNGGAEAEAMTWLSRELRTVDDAGA